MKIICEKIQFSYGHEPLFQNLNLSIQDGEHVWIRGRSGSGKSSLLKLIAGLAQPQSGRIRIGEKSIQSLSLAQARDLRRENVAYVHQENHLIEHWTTKQNIDLISADTSQIQKLFRAFNLSDKVLKQKISELSGGEKQRISLIRMLMQKPKLALLDEPTAHLDDFNTENLLKIVQAELGKTTLIVVSHDARIEKLGLRQIQISEIAQ